MNLVLVADDEPAVLEVLSQVVEDMGHQVLRAQNGEEALRLALARRPDLVVTDHMMPRMSGHELCRRLRADPALSAVPTLLLSAVLQRGVPEADVFLHKPFEITDFEAHVRALLARAPAPQPGAEPPPAPEAAEPLAGWLQASLGAPLAEARAALGRLSCGGGERGGEVAALEQHLAAMERVLAGLGAR